MLRFDNSSPDGNVHPLYRYLFRALMLGTIAVFVMFVGLSIFAYPAADDFCYAAKVKQLGFFNAQSFWYLNWSGRYMSNLTRSAFGTSGNIVQSYPYASMLVLVSTWLSFSFLAWTIARCIVSFRVPLLVGAIATMLFIAGTPDPAQTFYWVSGSFTYQLSNVFMILLIAMLIRRETGLDRQPWRALILLLSSLLTIAAIGGNEISLMLTVMILTCGAWYAIRKHSESRWFWLTLLGIGIAASLASVLAPGNFQRVSSLGTDPMLRPTPWIAVFLYLPWVALRLLYWLSNLGLWASAFIILIATSDSVRNVLYSEAKFRRQFLAIPALWIGMIFALNAVGFLINRLPLPERAESVVLLLFLLGWYPSFVILAHFIAGESIHKLGGGLTLPIAAFLLVSLVGTPNVFEGYKDAYRGYRYSNEMRERFVAIEATKQRGETEITLGSISRPPRTLFAADLVTDPNNPRNACMSEYYGLKAIRLGAPTRP